MKIVLLAPTPPPAGGIASWTMRVLNSTLKNGWEVKLVDVKILGNRPVFGNNDQKRNLFIEVKRCLTIWNNLRNALKDEDAKVVHSCIPSKTLSMMREYICACIAKFYKRKFIIHYRCTVPNTTRGKVGHFFLRLLSNKSDLIFSLNQQTTDYLKMITKTPIVLTPNFISEGELVDRKEVKPVLRTALYVGGVIRDKGAFDILDLAKKNPDIEFRLVGNASSEVVQEIEKCNITNAILTGTKNKQEVRQELENADIFLFLSQYNGEGFSNSLAEAMAAGLPCIVTDWAANGDMIKDAGGYVVKIGDMEALTDAMNRIKDFELRKAMSKANIEKVKHQYLDRVVLEQYVDAYESLLRKEI